MSEALAREAMGRVHEVWGEYIPPRLMRARVQDVFRFHISPISYGLAFKETFNGTFREACGISNETSAADFRESKGVDQFCSAATSNFDRKVHIRPGALDAGVGPHPFDAEAVLVHEYIHWLSHRNFYPNYYKRGGACPDHVEGCTEWMMITCYTGETISLAYESEFLKTLAWVDADRENNWKTMVKFVFDGEECDLTALNT